jgi:hypothetical protein
MAHAILLGATRHPDKLAELKELFWQEAERNCVLPLLDAFSLFLGDLPPLPTITRHTFAGDVQNIQTTMIPRIIGRSYWHLKTRRRCTSTSRP